MKEFMVEKTLENGEVCEYAVFGDGSRKKRILNDERYGKYFEVDNELNTDCSTLMKYSFSGRIKDAVDTIRSGNGDCIKQTVMFGRIDKVVYFIDRKVGEELRREFIEGWKDTKFGWAIECGYKNSFSGYCPVNTKGERISAFSEDRALKTFETRADAKEYVEWLLEKGFCYAKKLADAYTNSKNEEKESVTEKTIEEVGALMGSRFNVLIDIVRDMISGNTLKSNECKLDEYGYEIVQCVVQKQT